MGHSIISFTFLIKAHYIGVEGNNELAIDGVGIVNLLLLPFQQVST
jgi:hypothetical protein